MDVLVIGVNHRTAPLEIRERLHFGDQVLGSALRKLPSIAGVDEGMILSTCNRVEIYARSRDPQAALSELDGFFETFHGVPRDTYHPFLYRHSGREAVRHLFRVTASLDSLVIGEPQISGQVRTAFQTALEEGSAGPGMMPFMDRAMRVAKRVRTETTIAESAVSVSYAAVELARRIFGSMEGRNVLLVGASEMGELAARHALARRDDRRRRQVERNV